MEKAAILAVIFGPFLILIGLWMLLQTEQMQKISASFKATPAASYLNTILSLLVGIVILSQYHYWHWNLSLTIPLLGWLLVIRGILGLYIPHLIVKWITAYPILIRPYGAILVLWGLCLSWLAFQA